MSSDGILGIGPASVRHGDLLCILLHVDTPFILHTGKNVDCQLVGEAYIDRVMDGAS